MASNDADKANNISPVSVKDPSFAINRSRIKAMNFSLGIMKKSFCPNDIFNLEIPKYFQRNLAPINSWNC